MQETEIRQKLKGLPGKVRELFGGEGSLLQRKQNQPGKEARREAASFPLRTSVFGEEAPVLFFARGIACSAAAFLLASASLRGTYPLGLALLCACRVRLFFVYAGLLLSAAVSRDALPIGFLTYTVALILRLLLGRLLTVRREKGPRTFGEPLFMRMAVSSIAGFFSGLYGIFDSGFEKPALLSAIFLILVAPAAVFLYAGIPEAGERFSARHDLGTLALLFSLVLGLGAFSFVGFSTAKVAAVFLTLCASSSGGALRGGVTGMTVGLACGVGFSPLLGIAGILAGALKDTGVLLPSLAACGTVSACSLFGEGLFAFEQTVPHLLLGVSLYVPAAKLGLLSSFYPKIALFGAEASASDRVMARAVASAFREKDAEKRLAALSDALSSLSSVFFALSHRLTQPGAYEIKKLCVQSFKNYCKQCSLSPVCWGREYDRTDDVMNKLSGAVAKNGCADSEYVPDDFFKRCPHALKALSELNLSHARMLEAAARENKTEVFALDYKDMASLLKASCAEAAEEFEPDASLTDKVRGAALDMNLAAVSIAVFGKRRKTVAAGGVDLSRVPLSAEEIRGRLSDACGLPLTVPEFFIDGDYVAMTAHSSRKIVCESAKTSLKKEEETVNGDSAASFTNREDYFYTLICDGMGSGRDAAVTSRVTSIFLEKMLSAGNRKGVVLQMLNNFIRNKNLECFSTVDLLEVDLLSSSATFLKSGAAASYVIREKNLFKIASSTLPIGITREITAEEIRFSLLPGDLIVMISDGISQSFEDGVWLVGLLAEEVRPSRPLDDLAELILETAKAKNTRSDDMTVALVRVREA